MKFTKKKFALLIGVIVIVAIAALWFALAPAPYIYDEKEVVILNANEEQSFKEKLLNYYGGFSFDGTMELSVNKVTLYNSYTEANIKEKDIIQSNKYSGLNFLVLDMSIVNKNRATHRINEDDGNITLLSLSIKDSFNGYNCVFGYNSDETNKLFSPQINYFSLHHSYGEKNQAVDNYYHFKLSENEVVDFQIGFFVDAALYKNKNLMLKLGNSNMSKYGIRLE